VHGVKVIGTTHEMPRILGARSPTSCSTILTPHATSSTVVGACARADVTCRFVRRELDLDPHVEFGAASE
jgi:hypothetical protein